MNGRRAQHPHEKHMGSYELFASRDARELASSISEEFDLASTQAQFRCLSIKQKLRIESACGSMIEEFLSRTDSQRSPFLRKINRAAGDDAAAMFAVFAIIGLVRVESVLQLRDRYRYALAPGAGNRSTCAALYAFQQQVADLSDWEWPYDAFDGVDADFGSREDDADSEADQSFKASPTEVEKLVAKLEAMVAGNARQEKEAAAEAQQALFALHAISSTTFTLGSQGRLVRGTGAGSELFRCALTAKGDHSWVFVAFFRGKPRRDELIELIANLKPKARSAALGVPASLKDLIDPLQSAVGERYLSVQTLSAGNARLPFTRWPEDFLASLEVELALIGEPNVTIDELQALYRPDQHVWLRLECANPKGGAGDQLRRRDEIEAVCMQILAARGRWAGPVPAKQADVRMLPNLPGLHGDLEGATKEIAKLRRLVETGRASDPGIELHGIVTDVQRWIDSPLLHPWSEDQLGGRIVKFVLSQRTDRTGFFSVTSTLFDFFARGLPESDLVEAAVLRRLRRPVPEAWIPKQALYGTPPASKDLIAAYWCDVNFSRGGALVGFAGAPKKGDRFGKAIPEGTSMHVLPVFKRYEDAPGAMRKSWATRDGIWPEVLQAFFKAATGADAGALRKADWFQAGQPTKNAPLALVVIRAQDTDRIAQARAHWPRIVEALNADLDDQLKAENLPVTARFSAALQDFVAPFARKAGSRVALLLGESWREPSGDEKL